MDKVIAILAISALMQLAKTPFEGQPIAWEINEFCAYVQICLWVWYSFTLIKPQMVAIRSVLAAFLLWSISDVATYWIWWLYPNASVQIWPIFFFLMAAVTALNIFRDYNAQGDEINSANINLLLLRPKSSRMVFQSLIAAPVGSVCVYAFGQMWSFKWGKRGFISRHMHPESIGEDYIVIDTGIKASEEHREVLLSTIGKPAMTWRTLGIRARCVTVLRPLLILLGNEYIPILHEHIPAFYAAKLMRIRHDSRRNESVSGKNFRGA